MEEAELTQSEDTKLRYLKCKCRLECLDYNPKEIKPSPIFLSAYLTFTLKLIVRIEMTILTEKVPKILAKWLLPLVVTLLFFAFYSLVFKRLDSCMYINS